MKNTIPLVCFLISLDPHLFFNVVLIGMVPFAGTEDTDKFLQEEAS